MRTAAVAGVAKAVSNEVSHRQSGRWASEDQAQQKPGYRPPPPGRYQRPMFQRHYAPPPAAPPTPAGPLSEPPVTQPVASGMSLRLDQLRQLGELKAQGVLTDAEFATEKDKILNS